MLDAQQLLQPQPGIYGELASVSVISCFFYLSSYLTGSSTLPTPIVTGQQGVLSLVSMATKVWVNYEINNKDIILS